MTTSEKLERLREDVGKCRGFAGLYLAGVTAALQAVARRSPELAQVAESEAAAWSAALQPNKIVEGHHWSLDFAARETRE